MAVLHVIVPPIPFSHEWEVLFAILSTMGLMGPGGSSEIGYEILIPHWRIMSFTCLLKAFMRALEIHSDRMAVIAR